MHEQWLDQLSFYVAGTLPIADAAALEQHLRNCKTCQQSLQEWRQIAEVVRAEADTWSRQLPPLAPEVRAAVYARRVAPDNADAMGETRPLKVVDVRRTPSRPQWAGATLLAAVITLILFGGAVLVMMNRQPPNDEASLTQVAMLSEQTETVESSQTQPGATSTFAVIPTRVNTDIGIITATPVATAVVPPGVTQLPTNLPPTDSLPIGAGGGNGNLETSLVDSTLPTQSIPDGLCSILPGTSTTVPIYRYAGYEHEIVNSLSPGETLVTYTQSGTGWYEVVRLGEGLLGWVPANMVVLSGRACESLMLPTPTIPTECLVASAYGGPVNLRSGPETSYTVLDAFVGTDYIVAIGRSDNGWYRVRQFFDGNVWIGWVQATDVNVYGGCDLLPVILSAGYGGEIPPVMPTPTFTPTAATPPDQGQEPSTDPLN